MIVDSKKVQKRGRVYKKVVLTRHYQNEKEDFITWLARMGYAESTIKTYGDKIVHFFNYLQQQAIDDSSKITFNHIEGYYKILRQTPISTGYLQSHMNTLSRYCKYLELLKQQKVFYKNLVQEKAIGNPRNILTPKEVQLLFSSLENTPEGLLHRSLLHLYYSCGLRASEGARILPKDINYQMQLIYVVPGKNYQGRYVPINATVTKELREYEQYARPLINNKSPFFLVNPHTDAMNQQIVHRMLHKLLKKVTLPKHITLHCLRHSIATHLLNGGMDLESISRFLGHKTLDATQIYVHINNQMIYDTQHTL